LKIAKSNELISVFAVLMNVNRPNHPLKIYKSHETYSRDTNVDIELNFVFFCCQSQTYTDSHQGWMKFK